MSLNELGAGTSTLQQFEGKKQQAERLRELLNRGLSRQQALSLVKNVQSKATPEAQTILHQHINQEPPKQSNCPINEQ